jgi:hypothetical protein
VTYSNGSTVPWDNPYSIGAGTSSVPYGYGVTGFGQGGIPINPDYMQFLFNPAVAPGYIPGSGTYNQFALDQPWLFGTEYGQPVNYQYGSGGPGDPTTGREVQNPAEWVSGERLFTYPGANLEDRFSPLGNLFLRSDTPSGLGTPQIPDWAKPLLVEAIQKGLFAPTARGQQFMQQQLGINPTTLQGGAAGVAGAAGAGGTAGAGGAAGAGGTNPMATALASIAASQAADQAAKMAYQEWQMRTGDETLAQAKAQQAWSQKFQEAQQAFSQQYQTAGLTGQFNGQQTQAAQQQAFAQELARQQQALAQAGVTGQYQGAPTMAYEQQKFAQDLANRALAEQMRQSQAGTALSLLQQQSALQGPSSWLKYAQLNANTPQGMRDMVAGLAGQYNFAGSAAQGTPGAATLQSRAQDLLAPGQGMEGGATSQYALPNPNQVNLRSWNNASPTQQQMLMGAYAGAGYNPDDVTRALQAAAPRYAGPSTATVGF